jgi:hypothetical protein
MVVCGALALRRLAGGARIVKTNETNAFSGKLALVRARRDADRGKLNPWLSTLRTLEDCMQFADLSLPRIEGNSSRFTPSGGPSQSVKIETNGSPEPNIRADLQRAKGHRLFYCTGDLIRNLHEKINFVLAERIILSANQTQRSDLFYRLNVFPIRVTPLRERQEDIPLLVRHFVQQFARRMNRAIDAISCETMNALVRYPWPGNIRELQNLVERAVILSTGSVLRIPLQDLQDRAVVTAARSQTMEEAERAHILATLKDTKWVIAGPNGAAARLGMNRSTVHFRMKKLGIVKPWKLEN